MVCCHMRPALPSDCCYVLTSRSMRKLSVAQVPKDRSFFHQVTGRSMWKLLKSCWKWLKIAESTTQYSISLGICFWTALLNHQFFDANWLRSSHSFTNRKSRNSKGSSGNKPCAMVSTNQARTTKKSWSTEYMLKARRTPLLSLVLSCGQVARIFQGS